MHIFEIDKLLLSHGMGTWVFCAFLASFAAATVIPLSSEVFLIAMLAAGFNPILTLACATVGNWMGGLSSYWLGRLGKLEWIEVLSCQKEKIEKARNKDPGQGRVDSSFTWLPGIGDPIAIALGLMRANFLNTAFWMLIGKGARYAVWTYITVEGIKLFSCI